jgi:hypothetical protein
MVLPGSIGGRNDGRRLCVQQTIARGHWKGGSIPKRDIASDRQSIIENPLAWFLVALLLVVEYESHKRLRDLDRVCELFGSHDASYGHPATPREEIDTICNSWQTDDDEPRDP